MALSVVLITQNAAAQLPECLASVAFADEVVVVDSGSDDGTAQVAERYGARVVAKEWLGFGEQGRYMAALTFGNVHGVYAPGNVKLRPELLKDIQDGLAAKYGTGPKPLDLVFHGGSGSTDEEIAEAVRNGVVKMNIDTDTQYAFTRSIAGYMFENYDGVLKVDGSVGNKKLYDPRAWGKVAESAMAVRVGESTRQLGSAGNSISA